MWAYNPHFISENIKFYDWLNPRIHCNTVNHHLFLNSSASVRSLLFLSFIMPIPVGNVPLISPIFLKRSLVFPILLFFSIFWHCSFIKAFLSLLALLWNSAFSWVYMPFLPCLSLLFLSQLFVKSPQTTTLPSCASFTLGWSWSLYNVTDLCP